MRDIDALKVLIDSVYTIQNLTSDSGMDFV